MQRGTCLQELASCSWQPSEPEKPVHHPEFRPQWLDILNISNYTHYFLSICTTTILMNNRPSGHSVKSWVREKKGLRYFPITSTSSSSLFKSLNYSLSLYTHTLVREPGLGNMKMLLEMTSQRTFPKYHQYRHMILQHFLKNSIQHL